MNKRVYLIRGDCHAYFGWMEEALKGFDPANTSIIILGDAGLNYYLNNKDIRLKKEVNQRGFKLYIVRGNHEARPQDIPGMKYKYDKEIDGMVWVEEEYPNIRYFKDYGIYTINDFNCLVIGGAYSVDKYYRLKRVGITDKLDPGYYSPKKTGWFYNEQLSSEEMERAAALAKGQNFDFIFTHTCPYSWQPKDLFLGIVDQSTVDNTMEKWMDEIKDTFNWFVWCFGHFHADRIERPYVEQYYNSIENLQIIWERWNNYSLNNHLTEWWLPKSPTFYQ